MAISYLFQILLSAMGIGYGYVIYAGLLDSDQLYTLMILFIVAMYSIILIDINLIPKTPKSISVCNYLLLFANLIILMVYSLFTKTLIFGLIITVNITALITALSIKSKILKGVRPEFSHTTCEKAQMLGWGQTAVYCFSIWMIGDSENTVATTVTCAIAGIVMPLIFIFVRYIWLKPANIPELKKQFIIDVLLYLCGTVGCTVAALTLDLSEPNVLGGIALICGMLLAIIPAHHNKKLCDKAKELINNIS